MISSPPIGLPVVMASATVWKFAKGMTCFNSLLDGADDRAVIGGLHHNHPREPADKARRQKFPETFEQSADVPAGGGRHGDVVRQLAARCSYSSKAVSL